jgi:hypothetical protein
LRSVSRSSSLRSPEAQRRFASRNWRIASSCLGLVSRYQPLDHSGLGPTSQSPPIQGKQSFQALNHFKHSAPRLRFANLGLLQPRRPRPRRRSQARTHQGRLGSGSDRAYREYGVVVVDRALAASELSAWIPRPWNDCLSANPEYLTRFCSNVCIRALCIGLHIDANSTKPFNDFKS